LHPLYQEKQKVKNIRLLKYNIKSWLVCAIQAIKEKSMLSTSGHGEIAMKDFLQTATANL